MSQSVKWKNVLLKGSPQCRSTLEEQLQHLRAVPVNITYQYKICGFYDGEDLGLVGYKRFGETRCFYFQDRHFHTDDGATDSSETIVTMYQIARCHRPEDHSLKKDQLHSSVLYRH